MSLKAKYWVLIIVAALFIAVLLQNTEPVTLQLLFWSVSMSLIILVFILLLLGFVLGYVSHSLITRRKASRQGAQPPTAPSGAGPGSPLP
ncbi:MAG: LapA family protein [Calditrichaeota bacterium]|nr:MAG: LapA family protein [Calditrichota bacterium]